ncbi:sigma factor-like helix-turn-helix DNA-binding protein [Candidatus Halobeggiatoa sp. HSG11]|nr:sigma factor-like helix-turn-helix DNA-binding protein [Candidatus Halobeggiatoa sp. HSG11]
MLLYKDILIGGILVEDIKDPSDFEKELHYRLCIADGLKTFEKADKNATERLKALTLQIFEGLSIKEIAIILSRTEGATKQFLFETKKKLQFYLDKCWNEHD